MIATINIGSYIAIKVYNIKFQNELMYHEIAITLGFPIHLCCGGEGCPLQCSYEKTLTLSWLCFLMHFTVPQKNHFIKLPTLYTIVPYRR